MTKFNHIYLPAPWLCILMVALTSIDSCYRSTGRRAEPITYRDLYSYAVAGTNYRKAYGRGPELHRRLMKFLKDRRSDLSIDLQKRVNVLIKVGTSSKMKQELNEHYQTFVGSLDYALKRREEKDGKKTGYYSMKEIMEKVHSELSQPS